MVRRRYKKKYGFQRNKSIFKKRFFWQSFLAVFCFFVIFYFFFFSPVFQIKEIRITGVQKAPKEQIVSRIEDMLPKVILLFETKSIFMVNINQIEEALLENFPQIEGMVFNRELPAVLNIDVRERKGRALWCYDECYLIDKDGVIFEAVSENSPLMQIQIESAVEQNQLGQRVISKEFLASILEIEELLKEKAGLETEKVIVVSNERVNFKIREGWEIYFNLEEDFDWQITKLTLVLDKEILPEQREALEYVDLRFTRVYYK